MKSFKEYLMESKKVYEFKVKIAGDHKDASKQLKQRLASLGVESVSAGKRLPIAEMHIDFPAHTNTNVTIFDVTLAYPATTAQVCAEVCGALNCNANAVVVRNLKEEAENEINHAHDKKSGEALLGKDHEAGGAQDQVGEKQKMSLLKELSKNRAELTQYKGVNDEILAKSNPASKSEGPAAKAFKENSKSPVGSRKVTLPTAKSTGGL